MKRYVLMLLTACTLMSVVSVHATERSKDRQAGREAKQECRTGVVGNADCRQEKRAVKHQ